MADIPANMSGVGECKKGEGGEEMSTKEFMTGIHECCFKEAVESDGTSVASHRMWLIFTYKIISSNNWIPRYLCSDCFRKLVTPSDVPVYATDIFHRDRFQTPYEEYERKFGRNPSAIVSEKNHEVWVPAEPLTIIPMPMLIQMHKAHDQRMRYRDKQKAKFFGLRTCCQDGEKWWAPKSFSLTTDNVQHFHMMSKIKRFARGQKLWWLSRSAWVMCKKCLEMVAHGDATKRSDLVDLALLDSKFINDTKDSEIPNFMEWSKRDKKKLEQTRKEIRERLKKRTLSRAPERLAKFMKHMTIN